MTSTHFSARQMRVGKTLRLRSGDSTLEIYRKSDQWFLVRQNGGAAQEFQAIPVQMILDRGEWEVLS